MNLVKTYVFKQCSIVPLMGLCESVMTIVANAGDWTCPARILHTICYLLP